MFANVGQYYQQTTLHLTQIQTMFTTKYDYNLGQFVLSVEHGRYSSIAVTQSILKKDAMII